MDRGGGTTASTRAFSTAFAARRELLTGEAKQRDEAADPVTLLVDAAPRLQRLAVWGCSQLTNRFYEGHSREQRRVGGRSI